jgi:hypothetical protein
MACTSVEILGVKQFQNYFGNVTQIDLKSSDMQPKTGLQQQQSDSSMRFNFQNSFHLTNSFIFFSSLLYASLPNYS